MDNYAVAAQRACRYFLGFDQDDIIRRWKLAADEAYLYVSFLGKDYRICRTTGSITAFDTGAEAAFSQVLSIFDLLCHESDCKYLSGSYAPVNSLEGSPKTGGVGTDFYGKTAAYFDKNPKAFARACEKLKGQRVAMGDIGYAFPVFKDLQVILKFYHSDGEFPPALTLLWDSNFLQFVYYETVFYIAGFLLESIAREMQAELP